MAGRLNKIKQNVVICILVALLLLLRAFLVEYIPGKLPAGSNELNMWIALACAYLSRYRQHREVGLLDKADVR